MNTSRRFGTVVLLLALIPMASRDALPRAIAAEARTGAPHPASPDLTGTVRGPDGAPIPGATVYVYTAQFRVGTSPFCPSCYVDCGKRARTDAAGRFRIPALSRALIFRLLVVGDGFAPTFVPHVDPVRGGPVGVRLARAAALDPARTVTGTVVGPDGSPVAGATVEPQGIKTATLESYGEIDGMDPLAVTDSHGRFRLHCALLHGTVFAKVTARGFATKAVSMLVPGPAAANRITLTDGAAVAGVVRDAHGRGLPGVEVEVVPLDRSAGGFTGWQDIGTDAAGRFLVPNVPPGRPYAICVKMDGLARRGLGAAQRSVTTKGDDTVCGGVVLTVGPAATVTGRVTLSDGKTLPAGTRVMLGRDLTWDQQQAVATPSGAFTFRGAPLGEDLGLCVYVPGYDVVTDTPGWNPNTREVQFKPAAGSRVVNIRLAPSGSEATRPKPVVPTAPVPLSASDPVPVVSGIAGGAGTEGQAASLLQQCVRAYASARRLSFVSNAEGDSAFETRPYRLRVSLERPDRLDLRLTRGGKTTRVLARDSEVLHVSEDATGGDTQGRALPLPIPAHYTPFDTSLIIGTHIQSDFVARLLTAPPDQVAHLWDRPHAGQTRLVGPPAMVDGVPCDQVVIRQEWTSPYDMVGTTVLAISRQDHLIRRVIERQQISRDRSANGTILYTEVQANQAAPAGTFDLAAAP